MFKKKKKQKVNKPVVYLKTAFIITLLAVALAVAVAYKNFKKQTTPIPTFNKAYPTTNDVLGEQTVNVKKAIPNIPRQINDLGEGIAKSVNDVKTSTTDKINSVIYSTTLKPIVDKINSLPEGQQKEIKKEICR